MLQQVYAVCSVNEKNGFLVVKQGERSMQIGSLGKKISKRLLVFVMILLSLTILVVPVNVYAAGQEVAEVDGKRHTTLKVQLTQRLKAAPLFCFLMLQKMLHSTKILQ